VEMVAEFGESIRNQCRTAMAFIFGVQLGTFLVAFIFVHTLRTDFGFPIPHQINQFWRPPVFGTSSASSLQQLQANSSDRSKTSDERSILETPAQTEQKEDVYKFMIPTSDAKKDEIKWTWNSCPHLIEQLNGIPVRKPSFEPMCTQKSSMKYALETFNIFLIPDLPPNGTWKTGEKSFQLLNCSPSPINENYNYTVWGRLVGPTIVEAQITRFYGHPRRVFSVKFFVFEPGDYSLEIELRFAWSFSEDLPIFLSYNPDLSQVKEPRLRMNLRTNWIKEGCTDIIGSPFHVTIIGNSRIRRSDRMCAFRDIGFRGHWKKVATDCYGEDWKRKPDCYYDSGYGEIDRSQIDYTRRKNYTWVWEQTNCKLSRLTEEEMRSCFANFDRLQLIGDSLIRLLYRVIESDRFNFLLNTTKFDLGFKLEDQELNLEDINKIRFSTPAGPSIQLDDLSMVHVIGWDHYKGDIETSLPKFSELRKLLDEIESWLAQNSTKLNRRNIFLVTNYINDWRGMALWEPFVSEVSSYVISRLRKIGYEILDIRRMTRSRMDDSFDGLHYHRTVLATIMELFVSGVCSEYL